MAVINKYMANKIKHEHKCQNCGKPATINLQQNYQRYSINNDGNFSLDKEWSGDTNDFYCEDCAEKEEII